MIRVRKDLSGNEVLSANYGQLGVHRSGRRFRIESFPLKARSLRKRLLADFPEFGHSRSGFWSVVPFNGLRTRRVETRYWSSSRDMNG